MRRILPLLCCLLVAGCATLSEKECRTADWYQIGLRDGESGHTRSRIANHAEACGKIGVRVDEPAYFNGRERGLQTYCSPENGLREGLAGRHYSRVCPADSEAAFLDQYNAGREVKSQRDRIDSLNSQRRDLEQSLSRATTDEQRRRLRNELQHLDFQMRRERDYLWMLERRLSLPGRPFF